MTHATPPPWFLHFMVQIKARYPAWPALDGTADAYWMSLHDLSADQLLRALVEHSAHSTFAPSISELRALCRPINDLGLTAAEAWDEMRRNRKKYSPYDRNQNHLITWSSEAVRRAAEAVQWTDLSWTTEQIPTIRAQFERYYNGLVGKQTKIDNRNDAEQLVQGIRGMIGLSGPKELYGAPPSHFVDLVPDEEVGDDE